MKSTGIVRPVDDMGRFVLPMELRRKMNFKGKQPMEVYVEGDDTIVLKKYQPACIFCGGAGSLEQYKNRNICADCRAAIGAMK